MPPSPTSIVSAQIGELAGGRSKHESASRARRDCRRSRIAVIAELTTHGRRLAAPASRKAGIDEPHGTRLGALTGAAVADLGRARPASAPARDPAYLPDRRPLQIGRAHV